MSKLKQAADKTKQPQLLALHILGRSSLVLAVKSREVAKEKLKLVQAYLKPLNAKTRGKQSKVSIILWSGSRSRHTNNMMQVNWSKYSKWNVAPELDE